MNDLNWTKGLDPEDRQAGRIQPEARRADLQPRGARAARRRHEADLPDLARRHRASADWRSTRSRTSPTASAPRAASRRTARLWRRSSPDGGIDNKNTSEPRTVHAAISTTASVTAFDAVNHKVIAKAVTDIEIRSGTTATAGGLVFTALQDGWIVAYNDETLEELWRFNVGHAAQGRAGDLRDRPEAVSGRAGRRPASASGEVRQAGELELPVRVRAELNKSHRGDARAPRNFSERDLCAWRLCVGT